VPANQLGKPNPNSRGTINNNGLATFGGAGRNAVGSGQPNGNPGNPNGIYVCSELGWEPKLGSSKLEGKYAFGMIWWGIQDENFLPVVQDGRRLQGQGRQCRFLQHGFLGLVFPSGSDALPRPLRSEGWQQSKNCGESLQKRALHVQCLELSPSRYSLLDLYYQTGLIYQGLLPGRPDDRLGMAFGSAWFSSDAASAYSQTYQIQTAAALAAGKTVYPAQPQPTWGGVLEVDYQCMLTKWISVKPFAEFIMNPQQNGTLGNVFVLGTQAAVRF